MGRHRSPVSGRRWPRRLTLGDHWVGLPVTSTQPDAAVRSSWTDFGIDPLDVACALPEAALVGTSPEWLRSARLCPGSTSRHAQVIETVRTAFDPYAHGEEVRFSAA